MREIKRYQKKLWQDLESENWTVTMDEDKDGAWVKFSDHEAALSAQLAANGRLVEKVRDVLSFWGAPAKEVAALLADPSAIAAQEWLEAQKREAAREKDEEIARLHSWGNELVEEIASRDMAWLESQKRQAVREALESVARGIHTQAVINKEIDPVRGQDDFSRGIGLAEDLVKYAIAALAPEATKGEEKEVELRELEAAALRADGLFLAADLLNSSKPPAEGEVKRDS